MNNSNSDKLSNLATDALTNFKTMSALNLQQVFYSKYCKEQKAVATGQQSFLLKCAVLFSLRYGIDFIHLGGILLLGAYLIKINSLDIEEMITILQIMNSSNWSLLIVSMMLPDINAAIIASNSISKLLNYSPIINSKSENGTSKAIKGRIEFSNVSFAYRYSNSYALSSCSFTLNSGESLGITGRTGSGKSTIAMLLLRLYSPSSGLILIDNEKIENYNISYLRSKIGWVSQEPVLFHGSIFQNLQHVNSELTIPQAITALEKVQARDVIDIYGIHSDVGVRGSLLSGGQKQRVAIARALIRNPMILILDEATSALDNITEEKIRLTLRDEIVTVIAIAHRIDTIRNCDQIIIMEKGKVFQQGNHGELSKIEGIYQKLCSELNLI